MATGSFWSAVASPGVMEARHRFGSLMQIAQSFIQSAVAASLCRRTPNVVEKRSPR
jgi:hypothetical protein